MSSLCYSRLIARPLLQRTVTPSILTRLFSLSTAHRDDQALTTAAPSAAPASSTATPKPFATAISSMGSVMGDLARRAPMPIPSSTPVKSASSGSMASISKSLFSRKQQDGEGEKPLVDKIVGEDDTHEPFHFHIYSHRHNTHITVTRPNRKPIISMSCGNIGIRKSRRKNYDAAYQLTAYILERLYHQGWQNKINRLEVVLKGFGQGREAAVKVLLGTEGKLLADKIVRVSDDTKIKFGGCRSKNPRRI